MKKTILTALFTACCTWLFAQEYMQVTTVESVVPGGLGRSRMISVDAAGAMEEVNLENFYSLVGINFKNIRSNDKIITDKINSLVKQGWELVHVTAGVDPGGVGAEGGQQRTGIFITRYLFKKAK